MTEPVRIRAATPMDAAGIAAVHVETWRATYAGILPDNYLVSQSVDRLMSDSNCLLKSRSGVIRSFAPRVDDRQTSP